MLETLITRHLGFHDTRRPMAAMEIDYPNASSTGLHSHPRCQLLYAIEGVMVVRSSVGSWVVPPNRAVWLEAGLEHEVRMCGSVKIRTVFVAQTAAPHLPKTSCVIAVPPLLKELIVAAVDIPLDYEAGTRDERLMQLLLDELRQVNVLPLHLPRPRDSRIRIICETLLARPDDVTTVEQWAESLAITPRTIHRLFAQETGMTFGLWRQQARLMVALERLARGDRIIDVALDIGYTSHSAFTAMFRKHFGVAPGEFYR
jgi:AraC-like DNA-binding protein/mannose-6-phosphate isomerase-like protein (cupin superfamily)